MVWFIDDVVKGVSLLTSQCPISVPSLWKNSSLAFHGARMKATAQSSCSILNYSPVQRPVSLVCVSSSSLLPRFSIQAASGRPWAMRSLRPYGHEKNRCAHCVSDGHQQERERELLCSPWVITRSLDLGRTRCFLKINN